MSRSKPEDNSPNPSTRWFEWDGSNGGVRYYDKEKKANIEVGDKFQFILLDQLGTIKGWHDASESGIYSNEVKDTRAEPFVVKAFKGGVLAEGIYKDIRDRVIAQGGHFTTNLYIGYKSEENGLAIGSLQFKGAALRAWMEFAKDNRSDLYKKALKITGSESGKKGKITFKTPVFATAPIGEETDAQALELDKQLQEYLKGYFARTRVEQADQPAPHHEDIPDSEPPPDYDQRYTGEDDPPF